MAGDKNPWRDIFTPVEWNTIVTQATPANLRAGPALGGHRAVGGGGGWVAATHGGGTVNTPAAALASIQQQLQIYHGMPKDNHANWDIRVSKLKMINLLCGKYLTMLAGTHVMGMKQPAGKQLNDQLDIWVSSLGKRAIKKAAYLEIMKQWHDSAKDKYKDPVQMSLYLMGLHDNLRDAGEKLHATPYATMEKMDPYHRQTFVFADPGNNQFIPANEMGNALADFLHDQPANLPDPATNPNASFYEWLEYHPFCIGTPGVHGDARYKSPNRVKYDGHDLGYAYMKKGSMEYTRLISDPANRWTLNTSDFPPSGKGPTNAVAFIWDSDGHLYMHEHGYDGFVHASAKQGRKIRCSGMLVAANGLATIITNQSGHYAPKAINIFYFTSWLQHRNCLHPNARVIIEHDADFPGVNYIASDFIKRAKIKYGPPKFVNYHE